MKITYDDKISLSTSSLPRVNKCTEDDLNEIKEVVNENNGDVLYESETGTLENVTLSQNASNYDYIEIFAHTTEKSFSSKIYKPNDKYVELSYTLFYGSIAPAYMYITSQWNKILGNSIIRDTTGVAKLQNNSSLVVYTENAPYIYIDKVIGYKS